MAGASDIRAGRAFVELMLKDGAFIKGLRNASANLKSFGASAMHIGGVIAAGGAAITAPFIAAVGQFTSTGDQLDKMRQRTGLSVESLAELSHAADQSGTSIEDVEKALIRMAKDGRSVENFDQIAEKINAIEDPTLKAKEALEVWGKAGTKLLPMIEDLQALRQEARDLGLTMSGESAAAAVRLGDAFDNVMATVKFAAVAIGEALAPALQKATAVIQAIATTSLNWVRQNQELFRVIALVGAGLTAAGVALVAFGAAMMLAGTALGGVIAVLAAVKAAVLFLLSPIGLVIAALAGFTTWFLTATEAGASSLAFLGGAFGVLANEASTAFGAIGRALSAGDISAAVNVLWSFIKLEFQKGVKWINDIWQPIAKFFLDVWVSAVSSVSKLFIDAAATIQKAWMEVVDFFKDSWDILRTISVKIDDFANGTNVAARIEKEAQAAIAARDKNRQAAKAQIDADAAGAKGIVDAETKRRMDENQAASDAAIAKAQSELDAAKAGFRNAVANANALPSAAGGGAGKFTPPDKAKVGSLKSEAFGTFSGAALAAGGLGIQSDQLKELRSIRKAVEKQPKPPTFGFTA